MKDELHKDDDLYEDERILRHRKYHGHEDRIPHDSWKNYAVAFLVGVGITISSNMYLNNQARQEQRQERREPQKERNDYVTIEELGLRQTMYGTENASRLWRQTRYELATHMKFGPSGTTIVALSEVICHDHIVDESRLEQVLEMIRDDRTPIAKLIQKYKGPNPAPEPTEEDKARVRQIFDRNKEYRGLMETLIDEDSDHVQTEEERYKAIYKLLH